MGAFEKILSFPQWQARVGKIVNGVVFVIMKSFALKN
jgi:hypothetical protein